MVEHKPSHHSTREVGGQTIATRESKNKVGHVSAYYADGTEAGL